MNSASSSDTLGKDVIQALDDLSGLHPGYRPAHAKGILLAGMFTPSPVAKQFSRAPHLQGPATPVSVRFSNFAGIPDIPDNHSEASPRGIAIRFHLGEHVHTDIIGHSVDGFPVRTATEFLEFLKAIHASAAATTKPTPVEAFLATHPAAQEFAMAAKPIPTSFAREVFYAVNAYKFINHREVSRFGRYRIQPAEGSEFLSAGAAAAKPANFLFDEITARLTRGPFHMKIQVQLAGDGDVVDDSTVHWPAERSVVEFGEIEIQTIVPANEEQQRRIIFDPIPRVDGIEPSGDPLLEPRADTYLISGRRRRAAAH